MKPICTFKVSPCLPDPLKPLLRIAHNLRWAWDHDTIELFRRLDRDLWESSNHNPVFLLGNIEQSALESASRDESFLAHLDQVSNKLDAYLSGEGAWYPREHSQTDRPLVAYFSAEFGLTECLSIFAGGLGVLAGDHLKAASDLGVPLVGIGLLYQQGYFRQFLDAAGWQQEACENNDFHNLPIEHVPDVLVHVDLPEGPLAVQVWRVEVGRLQLFLLDTKIPQNSPREQAISEQLYGGDLEMRMKQEILLGIGGYRVLEALGLKPSVYHMNEGHSAFLSLELVCRLMETKNLLFHEAQVLASASLIFTTHTAVPAGHDYYPSSMVERYFSHYLGRLGISRSEFLRLGRENAAKRSDDFCMTVLALRLASLSNAVSKLHGEVTRKMWTGLWPDVPESEIPIGQVANGVHFRTWVSYEMNQLYDRYLGPKWREDPADPRLWRRAETIPAEELWRTHERRRERLVAYARRCLRSQLMNRSSPQADIDAAEEVLSPDALTIGFARRFALYKRANLLMRDPDRLARLLNDSKRPVQVIYAGKAHPNDAPGKELIRCIFELARRPEFRRRIVFLENYDMAIARYMVQGCDVWLNTPLRPLEASGTSGMKAQANGVLNVSTLDGWWDEGVEFAESGAEIGWTIGKGQSYSDPKYQDEIESQALYELLERDVVPMFYDRRSDGLPRRWVNRMESSMALLCPQFNIHRMVKQYTENYYEVAHRRAQYLGANGARKAKDLSAWLCTLQQGWPQIRVQSVETGNLNFDSNGQLHVRAFVFLGVLSPNDVSVEIVLGRIDPEGQIKDPVPTAMAISEGPVDGTYVYEFDVRPSARSGLLGFTIRILPSHPDLVTPFIPGLVTWAQAPS